MAEKLERTLFVLTANRLDDGRVVYRTGNGGWTRSLDEAEQLVDPALRDSRIAEIQSHESLVVTGCYAVEVGYTASGRRVLSAREEIRAAGEDETRRRLGLV